MDFDRALDTGLAGVPEVRGALDAARNVGRDLVDASLLEPCRRTVVALLTGTPHPVLPDMSPALAACLAFTEHFVIDVAAMPDDVATAVVDHLGAHGALDFAWALLAEEQRVRLGVMFERLQVAG